MKSRPEQEKNSKTLHELAKEQELSKERVRERIQKKLEEKKASEAVKKEEHQDSQKQERLFKPIYSTQEKTIETLRAELQAQAKQLEALQRQVKKMTSEAIKKEDYQALQMAQERHSEDLQHKIEAMSSYARRESEFQGMLDVMILTAAKGDNLNRVELALQMGANIEATDTEGLTPLFCSLLNGHHDLTNYLLEKKASLEALNGQGKTILHVMSETGDLAAVNFILAHLPKLDVEAKLLLTAYEAASTQEIKHLIADTILFQAAKQGNINLLKIALEKGANINAQDSSSETALHKASYYGHAELVSYLLEQSCSIVKQNKCQETPFQTGANSEIKQLISGFQDKKASIIQANVRGFFARKHHPLKHTMEAHRSEVQAQSANTFSRLATEGKFDGISKLSTAIKNNHLHEAMQIIRDKPEQEMETKTGFKVKY
jgi:ankyrin repeat protein